MKKLLKMKQDLLNDVSVACKEDKRLRDILRRILTMSIEEKKEFKKKMTIYFIGRDDDDDGTVKAFFQFVLDEGNAVKVAEKIGLGQNSSEE